ELTIDYTKSPYIVTSAPEYLNVNLTTDYKTDELEIEIKSTGYRFSNNITLIVNSKNISIKSISFNSNFITIIYNDTNLSGIYSTPRIGVFLPQLQKLIFRIPNYNNLKSLTL